MHQPPPMDDHARWAAAIRREPAFDGRFVYAVQSTGIYCRPSCPSRRPDRRKVCFFATPQEAEREGFRPCLRCRPNRIPADPWLGKIREACSALGSETPPPSLATLATRLGCSRFHLQRRFTQIVGVSPRAYADAFRLARFKTQLRRGQRVTAALYHAGYGSSSRLYERAQGQLGMTPATYSRGGKGMSMRYAIVDSPLGRLLVAATERGVCSIKLGDSDAALTADLHREYRDATIVRDDGPLDRRVRPILDHLRGRAVVLDLPVDVRATAFQWRVWQQLRAIPYGSTRSYGEVAAALGKPTAARAVARTCATNPVALAIPCHRIVERGGGLGGYRWGVERKRALLARERASVVTAAEKKSSARTGG